MQPDFGAVERTRRLVAEKDTVEIDFVSYLANASVFFVYCVAINPCIRHEGTHFAQEKGDDILLQWHILIVTQRRVGFVLHCPALFTIDVQW